MAITAGHAMSGYKIGCVLVGLGAGTLIALQLALRHTGRAVNRIARADHLPPPKPDAWIGVAEVRSSKEEVNSGDHHARTHHLDR